MSTFMAVIVLSGSKSYVFITFFKQLFLCTTLGVSHGLILLPVLLALMGPPAYNIPSLMDEGPFTGLETNEKPAPPALEMT